MVLGLGTYGRSFNLISPASTKIGAPCKGAGPSGPFTRESGFLAYFEICDKIKSGMSVVRDQKAMAPYGYQGKYWVGFDDVESLRYKVKKLIKGRGLKGAMFWSLDLDDFTGSHCGQGKYPLINAVKKELEEQKPIVSIISKSKNIETHPGETDQKSIKTTSTTRTTVATKKSTTKCFGKGVWFGNSAMNQWCVRNCIQGGNCNPQFCSCVEVKDTTIAAPITTTSPTTTKTTTKTPTLTTITTAPLTSTTFTTKTPPTTTTTTPATTTTPTTTTTPATTTPTTTTTTARPTTTAPTTTTTPATTTATTTTTTARPTTTTPATTTTTKTSTATATKPTAKLTTTATTKPTTTTKISTTMKTTENNSNQQKSKKCFGINIWYKNPVMDKWCNKNCLGKSCKESKYCSCDANWRPNTSCRGVGIWKENTDFGKWCNANCAVGYCPSNFCICEQ